MRKAKKTKPSSRLAPELLLAIRLSDSLQKLPPRFRVFRESLKDKMLIWDREALALVIAAREAGAKKMKTPLGPFSITYTTQPREFGPDIVGHLGRQAFLRRIEDAGASQCIAAKLFGLERPGVTQEVEDLARPNVQILVTRWVEEDGTHKERLDGFLYR